MPQSDAVKSRSGDSRSLTEGSIVGALVRLSVPIVMSNILQTAYQMTDTFWFGRLSSGEADPDGAKGGLVSAMGET